MDTVTSHKPKQQKTQISQHPITDAAWVFVWEDSVYENDKRKRLVSIKLEQDRFALLDALKDVMSEADFGDKELEKKCLAAIVKAEGKI